MSPKGKMNKLFNSNSNKKKALTNASTNQTPSNTIHLQARLCSDCWGYWKKHHAFKYPNARQERLNQLKNQVHKCSVNGCGREFKMKQLLVKHCGVAHGYFAKTNLPPGQNSPRPSAVRNRTSFFLLTTPMTKAARLTCTNAVRVRKLSRKPFKLVELLELNKEWTKDAKRNITEIIAEYKKKSFVKRMLDKELIAVIAKSYAKVLKRKKQMEKKVANGNHDENAIDEDNSEDESELIIEDDNEPKPEFLKYFENKCVEPCYVPETLLYEKPDKGNGSFLIINILFPTGSDISIRIFY